MPSWASELGDAIADAFFGVGVLVAIMLVALAWARARWGQRWDRWLTRYPKAGPAFAALLSVPPGCSGVIATITLYGERRVTYGTVASALLATMGDSAWILLAADPVLAIQLKLLFIVVGAAGGYAVDFLRIEPRAREIANARKSVSTSSVVTTMGRPATADASPNDLSLPVDRGTGANQAPPTSGRGMTWWEIAQPCCITPTEQPAEVHNSNRFDLATVAFWGAIVMGLIFAVPIEFFGIDEEEISSVFGPNALLICGAVGFGVCLIVSVIGRRHSMNCHCTDTRRPAFILRHTAYRTSNMITLVGLVSLGLAALTVATGFEPENLPFYGVAGVIVAALLGLLPSCGLEVVIASLFVAGGLPFPALLAYLISHDGAGLLPLFAIHRRSAIISTVITTIPAAAIGLLALQLS